MRPEVLDRRTRVLEPLDHHPLEALAQNRLDRALHAGRHLEEIRHRPHDARQRRRAPLVEHGAHARAVALAGAFERCERVEARPVGSQRNPRVRQRGLRLGQAPLVRRQSRRQSVALTRELAELRACHVTRLGEARAKRVDPRRLGLRLAELDRESLRAPAELPLELALHLLDRLAEVREPVVALLEPLALLRLLRRELGGARPERLLPVAQTAELRGQPLAFGDARHVLGRDDHEREVALGCLERLVLLRLLRLPLERGELAFDLVHDVAHADEVLPGRVELALGLVTLLLVARDARRLLDEDAPLVRLRRQDVVELVLVHDRVGARVRAGAGEEVEDVAQTCGAPVEEILALTRPVEPPRDRHFGPRHRQRAVVAEGQLDFGEPDRLSRLRAVEDQVFHALAAERLRALLAERPAHGLAYIRLSASVRPDDARDAGQDPHHGLVAERLEPVQRDGLKTHEVFLSRTGSYTQKNCTSGRGRRLPGPQMSRLSPSGALLQVAALLVFLAGAAGARVVTAHLLPARRPRHRARGGRRRCALGRHGQLTPGLARVRPCGHRRQLHRRVPDDLDLEQPLDDGRLHALDHVLEEVERFLLVLGERVPLAVAPEPDPLLQVVDGQEMVLPLRVHDHQHLVALEGAHEVRAELALALRVSLADRRADQLREPLSRDRLPEARGRNPHVERAEERLAEPAESPVLRVSVLGRVAVERPRDEVLGPLRDRLRLAFPLEDLTTHAVDDLALLVHHVVVLEEMLADLVVVRLHALLRRRDRARHELVLDRLALLHPEALHDLLDAL